MANLEFKQPDERDDSSEELLKQRRQIMADAHQRRKAMDASVVEFDFETRDSVRQRQLGFLVKEELVSKDELQSVINDLESCDVNFAGFELFYRRFKNTRELKQKDKDPFEAIKFYRYTQDVGFVNDIYGLATVVKDDEILLRRLLELGDKFKDDKWILRQFFVGRRAEKNVIQDGLDIVDAYLDSGLSRAYLCDVYRMDLTETKRFIDYAKKIEEQEKKIIPVNVVNLWVITEDIGEARVFYKLFSSKKSSVLDRGPGFVKLFFKYLGNEFSREQICDLCVAAYDPEEALKIHSFVTEFNIELFPHGGPENEAQQNRLEAIKWAVELAGEDPAKRAFAANIFERSDQQKIGNTSEIDSDSVKAFFADPALKVCSLVYEIEPDVETALNVGRNLYLKGFGQAVSEVGYDMVLSAMITPELVSQEKDNIAALRAETWNLKVYEGRNVLFAYHSQHWTDGSQRFRDPKFMADLAKQNPKSVAEFGSKDEVIKKEKFEKIKENFLSGIVKTLPPMTCIFNGHGGEEVFCFSEEFEVTADEIAKALVDRTKHFKDKPKYLSQLKNDIFIFSCCNNHTFLRHVYEKAGQLGAVLPISIGESEYGLPSYSQKYTDDALVKTFSVKLPGAKIGDIIQGEKKYKDSNVSIYIPDRTGTPHQVAKNEKKHDGNENLPA